MACISEWSLTNPPGQDRANLIILILQVGKQMDRGLQAHTVLRQGAELV